MKLTAKIKLQATDAQKDILLKTLETGNAACNYISGVAWQSKEFNQYRLHNLVYYDAKDKFSIGSQLTIRCIAKVTDSYKKDRRKQRFFKQQGAIPYDDKMLRYELNKQVVSIWTVKGRQEIPFAAGTYAMQMLESQHGESKLILQRGNSTCWRRVIGKSPLYSQLKVI